MKIKRRENGTNWTQGFRQDELPPPYDQEGEEQKWQVLACAECCPGPPWRGPDTEHLTEAPGSSPQNCHITQFLHYKTGRGLFSNLKQKQS